MDKDLIFNKLWDIYTVHNPSVQRVYDSFVAEGEQVLNDHIAFRTYNDPRINVDVLSAIFLKAGYEEKGQYVFKSKHLFAKHFEHKDDKKAPRVFISELVVEDFSPELGKIVKECVDKIPSGMLSKDELIYAGALWGPLSYQTYETLRRESEYAAWLYVYGFCANHFTVSINGLKKLDSIEKVNEFLKSKGFMLNDSGGEIKGTPAELLEQSSIRAETVRVDFREGTYDIPGCYYEFARRYPDSNGELYSGFIAKSADKIFESTDFYDKPTS